MAALIPPTWVLFSLMANVSVQFVEYLNRSGSAGFFRTLVVTGPFIVLAQWGLYESWRNAPHFLAAWLVFTVGNAVARLAVSRYVLGETYNWYAAVGVAMIMAGALVTKSALHTR